MIADKRYNRDSIKHWLILFVTANIIFSFYQIHFFWGNHDWDWIQGTTQVLSLNTGMFEGRFAKFILNVMLFGGQILPILNNMISFSLLGLGSILLVKYWQIKNKKTKIIVAMLLILSPFILGWLYFPINILGNFTAVTLVATGLLLSIRENLGYKVLSMVCFLLALGVYPSTAEMMIICFCFRYIINKNTNNQEMRQTLSIIICSFLLFKLLLFLLGHYGLIVNNYYNLQTRSIQEIIQNLPHICKIAFLQLVTTIPFLSPLIKAINLFIVIAAVFSRIGLKQITLWLIAFGATVFSSALTNVPAETEFMPRVNFYGLNFFYAGAFAVLLQNKKYWQNIGTLLAVILLYQYIVADFNAQKVWVLGKKAEENLIERISARISPQISQPKIPVVAGEISLRPRYYFEKYQRPSPYILNTSFMVRHIPSGIFNFYASKPLFYGVSQIDGYDMSEGLYNFLHFAIKPWPSEEAVYIDEKYAIILLTHQGIKAIQAQLPK